MKWSRLLITVLTTGFILITVAIQTEKPALQLAEMRSSRHATHFRQVEFVPGTRTAWAVGFNGTVLRSDDAGKTWIRMKTQTKERFYGLQVISSHSICCCGSEGTLLMSSNGGRTWKKMPVPTHYRLLDVFFSTPENGWVVGDNGCIMRTTDGGKTWSAVDSGIRSGFRQIWFSTDGQGLISGYEGILLQSDDNGVSWSRLDVPEHISFYGMSVRDDGAQCHLVGSCGMMVESVDHGRSWTVLPVVATNFLRDIAFDPDGYGCAVGYGIILSRSPDSKTWKKCADLPGINLQSVSFGSDGCGLALGQWGAVLQTENHGLTWRLLDEYFAPDLHDIAFDSRSGTIMAVGADGWILHKRLEETAWQLSNSGSRNTLKCCTTDQQGRFWVSGSDSGSVRRMTASNSWERVRIPAEGTINDILFTGESRGYIVGDYGLFVVTEDTGDSWRVLAQPTRRNIRGIAFPSATDGFLFGDDGLIMETTDGGANWMRHDTGVTSCFRTGWFGTGGHALVASEWGGMESWSSGHNSSWFEIPSTQTITAIAAGGRYVGLCNGDILDRRTGISRCISADPILSFVSNTKGNEIWGAGQFGRITSLKTNDINLLLSNRDGD